MIQSVVVSALVAIVIGAAATALWRAFERRGEPGWSALVPLLNLWVLVKVARLPRWVFGLTLVPYLNVLVIAGLVVRALRAEPTPAE